MDQRGLSSMMRSAIVSIGCPQQGLPTTGYQSAICGEDAARELQVFLHLAADICPPQHSFHLLHHG